MRRFGRYILNALTAMSLLLCTATALLWSANRHRIEKVSYGTREHAYLLVGRPIGIYLARGTYHDPLSADVGRGSVPSAARYRTSSRREFRLLSTKQKISQYNKNNLFPHVLLMRVRAPSSVLASPRAAPPKCQTATPMKSQKYKSTKAPIRLSRLIAPPVRSILGARNQPPSRSPFAL
jgi:hypothetical protein